MNLFYSYDQNVEKAYIIRIYGNKESEKLAEKCAVSCESVGQPHQFWDAYDGTQDSIIPPANESEIMDLVKVTDHYLTRGEIACALSHISLWSHCVKIDRPIVILEHDSVMINAYEHHAVFNSICYLGGNEQFEQGWSVFPTPPHGSEGPNYHFICRAHAYAVDPSIAKNLLAHAIKYGICSPLDIMIRADIFPMHQIGMFAYDTKKDGTTILGRPENGRSTFRNDRLEV